MALRRIVLPINSRHVLSKKPYPALSCHFAGGIRPLEGATITIAIRGSGSASSQFVSPTQSVSRRAHYVIDKWPQNISAKDAGTFAIRFIGLRTCHSSESKQSYRLHSYRLEWGEGVSALISNSAARVKMYIRTLFGES